MNLRQSLFVAACLAAFTVPAFADTTVTVLHVSDNANMVSLWNKIAKDYEASASEA